MNYFLPLIFSFVTASTLFAGVPVMTQLSVNTPICLVEEGSILMYKLKVEDTEGDPITITSIVSSNESVLASTSVTQYTTTQVGNFTYIDVYGDPTTSGTVFLTITVADEGGSSEFTTTPVTVNAPNPPSFLADPIVLCSSSGIADLNNFMSSPGSSFYVNSLEQSFDDGLVDTDDAPFEYGTTYEVEYMGTVDNCHYTVYGNLVMYESAYLGMENSGTDCGEATGEGHVFPSGGDEPVSIVWSSGQQGVNDVTGLAAGAYSVQATTAMGCVTTKAFIIQNNDVSVGVETTDVTCFGGDDGSIQLFPDGLATPYTTIWSSGHSVFEPSGLTAGTYTGYITDANNCKVVVEATIYQPEKMDMDVYTNYPTCGEENGDATVETEYGGVQPFTYAWSNGGEGNMIEDIGYGIYSVTATDLNGCIQVKTIYVSENGGAELYGYVTPANCNGNDGAIETNPYLPSGINISSISWTNGATTPSIYGVAPGTYVCTLVTDNNCHAVKGWTIPAVKPLKNDICVLTVDDETTTNLVVWEKVQTTGIAYYNIYRETSQPGDFALIDTVHADNQSLFNDVVASPVERSWKYKISAVNTCGEEGPLSLPHQTIHLEVIDNGSGGVTVSWNAYQGTTFANYFVSRYTDAAGWEEIATLPATQLTYQDILPITTPGLDYVVEMELASPCTAEKSQDFNSSRSNKDRAQFNPGQGTGDSNNELGENYLETVTVAPNPATNELIISQDNSETIEISITTIEGQNIQHQVIRGYTETIDISNLSAGVYIINMAYNGTVKNVRIIKM